MSSITCTRTITLMMPMHTLKKCSSKPVPPAAPVVPECGEEDPEEIEGVSNLDSEHRDPEPNP
jgi:hypothetical protein